MGMERVEKILGEFATPSVIFRRNFLIGSRQCSLLFHPDLVDPETLRAVLLACESFDGNRDSLQGIYNKILYVNEAEILDDYLSSVNRILSGDAVLFLDGVAGCIIVNARKYSTRAVAEPPTETVMRGPREGFIEDFKTNLSLIEKRLKTQSLAVEKMQIGRVSSTSVALIYISTIAAPDVVNSVRKKLQAVDVDALIDSFNLQPYLEERPLSMFSQIGVAEKPDIVVGKLLEGRVAIVVDGSPMVLTLPFLLVEDFHSSEDYYERHSYATFLRIMRFFSVILSVLLPGLYVSLQVYNYEIVPMKLLITILNSIQGIPFPPLIETIFVLLLFEMIREASLRMPRSVGTAMSIVGAIVLGDTAVKAGLISSPAVMIIALSSIALYTVPNQIGCMTLLRLAFTLVGGLAGLYGLIIASIFLINYMVGLSGYGAPYLAPFAPLVPSDLKDSLLKAPQRGMTTRPQSFENINENRL